MVARGNEIFSPKVCRKIWLVDFLCQLCFQWEICRERKYQTRHIWIEKQSTGSKYLWTSPWGSTLSFLLSFLNKQELGICCFVYLKSWGMVWTQAQLNFGHRCNQIPFCLGFLALLPQAGRLFSPARWPPAVLGEEVFRMLPAWRFFFKLYLIVKNTTWVMKQIKTLTCVTCLVFNKLIHALTC